MTSRIRSVLSVGLVAVALAAVFLVCRFAAFAQSGASPAPAQPSSPQQSSPSPAKSTPATVDKSSSEIDTHDAPTAFKVSVRLVLVHAVIRDAQGRAIGTFQKDDFQLFDNGKLQAIKHFAVEQPSTPAKQPAPTPQPGETATTVAPPPQVPDRFVIYLFDDVHLENKYLLPARTAAERHIATLRPTDRAAVFTTSGQGNLDFTDDRDKLHEALMRIQPRPILNVGVAQCPYMTYYMADQIANLHDAQVLAVATQDAQNCGGLNSPTTSAPTAAAQQAAASQQAQSAAVQALSLGDAETRLVLGALKDTVRRISVAPGQRTLVLISPGFITPQLEDKVDEIIEKAVRSNVTINVLDARGLYTVDAMDDISRQGGVNPLLVQEEFLYATSSESSNQLVLGELADATGGVYFHNNNDLDEGFRRVASAPEYSYVIGFSPQNLKLDGHYHKLKLILRDPQNYRIQARQGYYAPKRVLDPAEQDKQEIEEALFSQDELHDIPIDLHTQFFKSGSETAKLTVLAHVDVKGLHFRKVDGRNLDNLTIVSALFNRNGDFIEGNKKILEMRLKDETLERKLGSGITMRTSFDVKPGGYLVRLVVRDAEDRLMSAKSGAVEIP